MLLGKSVKDVKDKLEDVINKMLYWFEVNEMKVNNDQFQFILFSKNGMCKDELIKVMINFNLYYSVKMECVMMSLLK